MNAELKDILFLDIETIGCTDDYSSLNDRLKAQWARKSIQLRRSETQTDEEVFYNRAGIYAEFGRIIVIAIGRYIDTEAGELGLKIKYFAGHDEKALLQEFKSVLERMDANTRLCAHNGKEFDFPYLCRRMLVNGVMPPAVLNQTGRKPWEVTHLDTMDMWKFGDFKHYTSLDLLSTIFNIPSSKGVMDGSQVSEVYYKEKNLTKIAEYCLGDVIAIAQLYLRYKCMELIDSNNIINSQ